MLDRYAKEIRLSWQADQERWYDAVPEEGAFEQTVEYIREMITLRRESIAERIDTELTNVFGTVTFTDGEQILAEETLYAWEKLSAECFPAAPEKTGCAFLRWEDETGAGFDHTAAVTESIRVHPVYQAEKTVPVPESTQEAPPPERDHHVPLWVFAAAALVLFGVGAVIFLRKGKKK